MRGTDWHVCSEATGELHMGLLLHIVELRKYSSGVLGCLRGAAVVYWPPCMLSEREKDRYFAMNVSWYVVF